MYLKKLTELFYYKQCCTILELLFVLGTWSCFDSYINCLGTGLSYIVIISSASVGFVPSPDPGTSVLKKNLFIQTCPI